MPNFRLRGLRPAQPPPNFRQISRLAATSSGVPTRPVHDEATEVVLEFDPVGVPTDAEYGPTDDIDGALEWLPAFSCQLVSRLPRQRLDLTYRH